MVYGVKIDWLCQVWSGVTLNPEQLSFRMVSIIKGIQPVLWAGNTQEIEASCSAKAG